MRPTRVRTMVTVIMVGRQLWKERGELWRTMQEEHANLPASAAAADPAAGAAAAMAASAAGGRLPAVSKPLLYHPATISPRLVQALSHFLPSQKCSLISLSYLR